MVKPKKYLGQHFLRDENIAQKTADSLSANDIQNVLEIGPGTGVLTKYLMNRAFNLHVIEIDDESIDYLKATYPELSDKIIHADFLKTDLTGLFNGEFAIIGNFPYNISNLILFKIYENRTLIPEMCGMFQKEVAERICSKPGSKVFGILSVLIQAFYDVEYLFTVSENVFFPPPKVKSAVIRMQRRDDYSLNCDEALFLKVVKTGFNQRRKTLRNSLKSLTDTRSIEDELFSKRPEQLNVESFVKLTNLIKKQIDQNG